MLVRHDAKIRVITTFPICPDGSHLQKCRETKVMTPSQLEGHLLVLGALYNVSGYVNPNKPRIVYKIRPEDVLGNGKLCPCEDCQE